MNEAAFIDMLRAVAAHPEARGLADDAAVLDVGGRSLVLTHDMLAEGIHFLADDPPADVAWKLLAVNMSDLAAKGAQPLGVLLGYSLSDEAWDRAFVEGLVLACRSFGAPLLGGDTVAQAAGTSRSFALTAIGEAAGPVPARSGGRPGDQLWVSGSIGDAGAGLRVLRGELPPAPDLVERYRNPRPRLRAGERLAPIATAMMDVSDGLLIDASRIAAASGCQVAVDLAALPMSEALLAVAGSSRAARLEAATAGDDYELLFTAPRSVAGKILHLGEALALSFTPIGEVAEGSGLCLRDGGAVIPLPPRLGYLHRT